VVFEVPPFKNVEICAGDPRLLPGLAIFRA